MTCIIRTLTSGIPCPTCGVTRAMISLLKGDLEAYCHYNILALPLCLAFFLALYGDKKKNNTLLIISIVIFLLNFPYYIWRLANGLIP